MSGVERRRGVVVHIDEAGEVKQKAVLVNVSNLLEDLPDGSDVEIVAHGPGIDICLGDSPTADLVQALLAQRVVVAACGNTLARRAIDRGRVAPGVTIVPSGVGELVRKQWEGWAYLRP